MKCILALKTIKDFRKKQKIVKNDEKSMQIPKEFRRNNETKTKKFRNCNFDKGVKLCVNRKECKRK